MASGRSFRRDGQQPRSSVLDNFGDHEADRPRAAHTLAARRAPARSHPQARRIGVAQGHRRYDTYPSVPPANACPSSETPSRRGPVEPHIQKPPNRRRHGAPLGLCLRLSRIPARIIDPDPPDRGAPRGHDRKPRPRAIDAGISDVSTDKLSSRAIPAALLIRALNRVPKTNPSHPASDRPSFLYTYVAHSSPHPPRSVIRAIPASSKSTEKYSPFGPRLRSAQSGLRRRPGRPSVPSPTVEETRPHNCWRAHPAQTSAALPATCLHSRSSSRPGHYADRPAGLRSPASPRWAQNPTYAPFNDVRGHMRPSSSSSARSRCPRTAPQPRCSDPRSDAYDRHGLARITTSASSPHSVIASCTCSSRSASVTPV